MHTSKLRCKFFLYLLMRPRRSHTSPLLSKRGSVSSALKKASSA